MLNYLFNPCCIKNNYIIIICRGHLCLATTNNHALNDSFAEYSCCKQSNQQKKPQQKIVWGPGFKKQNYPPCMHILINHRHFKIIKIVKTSSFYFSFQADKRGAYLLFFADIWI